MTQNTRNVDVAVVGAGTAGLNAWRSARATGKTALMIDPGPLGTTCARVGCMPSKLVIAAGEAAHHVRQSATFGVHTEGLTIDPVAVMQRVRTMRDVFVNKTLNSYTEAEQEGLLIREPAVFVDAHTLRAGGETIQAKAIVLATGSAPWIPPPYREIGDALLTNESIFELEQLPKSLLVVGAGPIGLELGQAFHRLGVRVTILDLEDRIGGLADPDVAATAREVFGSELDMHLHHQLKEVKRVDDGVKVTFVADDGALRDDPFQYVLVATGRRPNLDGLGLDAAGLAPLPPRNPTTGQLGQSHLFMAGDATGDRMILHEASHEGRLAGRNAARFPTHVAEVQQQTAFGVVFSDPQITAVGVRWTDLDPSCIIEDVDFVAQSRAKVLAKNRGRGKLYADAAGKLIGAELLGPDVEHLGHLLAWVIQLGLSASDVVNLPFYHPVLEEALKAPLGRIAKKTR